jgi:hypothetical protein
MGYYCRFRGKKEILSQCLGSNPDERYLRLV